MKVVLRSLALLGLLSVSPVKAELLYGVGFANNLVGPQLEWAGRHYTAYVLPGLHTKDGGLDVEDIRWVIGARYRLDGGTTVTNGFYVGAVAGDLGKNGGKKRERYGIGMELGHQWVTTNLRWTLGAGIAALERQKCEKFRSSAACSNEETKKSTEKEVEPTLVITATMMLRR